MKPTVVFDLDATLIHGSTDKIWSEIILQKCNKSYDRQRYATLSDNTVWFFVIRRFALELLELASKHADIYLYTMSSRPYADFVCKELLLNDRKEPYFTTDRIFTVTEQEPLEGNVYYKSLYSLNSYLLKQNRPAIPQNECIIIDDRKDIWVLPQDSRMVIQVPMFEGQNALFDTALLRIYDEFKTLFQCKALFETPHCNFFNTWQHNFQSKVLQNCKIQMQNIIPQDIEPFFKSVIELEQGLKLLGADIVDCKDFETKPTHIIFGQRNELIVSKKVFVAGGFEIAHVSWLMHIWFFRKMIDAKDFMNVRPEYTFSDFSEKLFLPPEQIERLDMWNHTQRIFQYMPIYSQLQLWCSTNPEIVNKTSLDISLQSSFLVKQKQNQNSTSILADLHSSSININDWLAFTDEQFFDQDFD